MAILSAWSNFDTWKDFKKVEIKKEFVTKNVVPFRYIRKKRPPNKENGSDNDESR